MNELITYAAFLFYIIEKEKLFHALNQDIHITFKDL